ncbi:usg protein [Sphingobium sp. SJ10-10]|uniref:usg protein n=1 Tax=unclassified Sphingobium TaxID=2611147 RepID=UPI0007703718|nr:MULTISPECIES: usg protein [unclassified Sphingobium]AMK24663.1 Usg-like protein [Sphingobium sp. TKS]MEC6698366.1 usg protein [Sphingobium sp. SJ10-10]
MSRRDFIRQFEGHRLTTAEIHYYRPDAPSLLQLFVWQEYDLAPDFPVLFAFLEHWRREIEAALHSVRISHDGMIRPTEWRAVDGVIDIQ